MSLNRINESVYSFRQFCRNIEENIIGFEIVGRNLEKVGKVSDVIVETENQIGRYIIAEPEKGTFTARSRIILIPIRACEIHYREKRISSDITCDVLGLLPSIRDADHLDRNSERILHAIFDLPPYWAHDNGQNDNEGALFFGY